MPKQKKLPVIRCSSLPQLALCPGAYNACAGIKSPDTADSLEGTQCHLAMESYYLNVDFDESRLSDRGMMLTRWYKREMDALIEKHEGATLTIPELHLEARIPSSNIMLSGHIDLAVFCGDGNAIIADWKFGHLEVVAAAKNTQLMGYTWLMSEEIKANDEHNAEKIFAYLFSAGSDKAFTGVGCNGAVFANIGKFLTATATAAMDKDAPRIPSEPACRYCQASGTDFCPESVEYVEQTLVGMELIRSESALPTDQRRVVEIYNAIKQVESFGKKFSAMLKAAVEADPEAWKDSFVLKDGNKTRKIKDVQGVYDILVTALGLLDSKKLLGLVSLPIGALEKALREPLLAQDVKVGQQAAYIGELLSELIETAQNAPSIVPAKRGED